MRPLIAVTGRRLAVGRVERWRDAALATPRTYLDAVQRAGGQEAVLMPVPLSAEAAVELLGRFDGLLLTGGPDVDPALYGQEARPEVYGVDTETDTFELALARGAVETGLPLLAICRGIQVLNVAMGGTLDQHIPDRAGVGAHGVPGTGAEGDLNAVKLEPGSLLAEVMGTIGPKGCCHHHQAVDRIADGLRAVGWADDGVIEAVEVEGDVWMVGVQWHPEDTAAHDPAQQRLFDAFVRAAAS